MRILEQLKTRARDLKRQVFVLYAACRDPRVPWYAKALALAVVAYAFSPIDLIPDFIPVLGLLDDMILVPLGVLLVLRLIPEPVLADYRAQAEALAAGDRPTNRVAAALVIAAWLLGASWLAVTLYRLFGPSPSGA
jgi:uncharacterized membrane protein YkvA (DUF1232 family)